MLPSFEVLKRKPSQRAKDIFKNLILTLKQQQQQQQVPMNEGKELKQKKPFQQMEIPNWAQIYDKRNSDHLQEQKRITRNYHRLTRNLPINFLSGWEISTLYTSGF